MFSIYGMVRHENFRGQFNKDLCPCKRRAEEWQSLFTVKLKAFDKEYVMIEFDSEKVVKSGTTQTWLCACLNAQKRQALKKVI